ncbi:MAG: hypothetical protein IJY91_01550 [Oscillospiraceae bacterium]|nr:hypothetical protein [Oscillospiraceae bacterium]
MERITRVRARALLLIFVLIVSIFAFYLYYLQIVQTGGQADNATVYETWTSVKAARGEILDRNGNVLVGNRAGYKMMLNHYVILSADGTYDHLYRLAMRCKEQNILYNESFPISKERPFTYTLDEYNSAQQRYFQAFLNHYSIDSDITAPLLIQNLRNRYELPESWTDEEARLVIGLVYEVMLRNCVQELPVYEFISDADDATRSAVAELNVPGMRVEATNIRVYYTDYAAHILGHVGSMSAAQWEEYKDIDGYQMDTKIGQSGLEKAFEEYLHGVDGVRKDTVAADGTLISSVWEKKPQAGANVELTIDINLQRIAEDQMAAMAAQLIEKGGDGSDVEGMAVVALDPNNGEVLVCASYPTYDLDTFFEDYDKLIQDPLIPTYNRALLGLYPPGSTYKMNMVVAGINAGTITSHTTIYDAGKFTKYTHDGPTCLAYTNGSGSHGTINAAEALKVSCNYFFYELGDKMRLKDIDSTAKALGLGEKTGVELFEEPGYRANEETKAVLYNGDLGVWSPGDQVAMSIGQSDNLFTPIQLAVYTGTLGMKGLRYQATFLNRVVSSDYRTLVMEKEPSLASTLEISEDAYAAYSQGMQMVTSESGGTAYSTFRNYPIAVAGKTGTAQHGGGGSENGAFVCYAPANQPEIAIAVYGEKAGHGSTLVSIAKAMLDAQFEVGEIGDVPTYENKLS